MKLKKYRVWFNIDQAYEVEAESSHEAQELIRSGEFGDECIVEERNHEWLDTEIVKELTKK